MNTARSRGGNIGRVPRSHRGGASRQGGRGNALAVSQNKGGRYGSTAAKRRTHAPEREAAGASFCMEVQPC